MDITSPSFAFSGNHDVGISIVVPSVASIRAYESEIESIIKLEEDGSGISGVIVIRDSKMWGDLADDLVENDA